MKTLKINVPTGYEVDTEKSTFENIVFKEIEKDITERIKTIEDACKYLGEIDDDVRHLRLLQNIPNINRRNLAGQELTVIAKALNEGTILDWDNHDQYKYIPWWYLGKDFRLCCVCECCTYSFVGAPLYVKSRELADYSAKQFKSIWKDYLN
ncbi:MAG TPA: hypothetical protein VLA48_02685 [Nitrososphaeraceae archaeon]|nr:hypothetical protein [Nitrososphaeraceae archaeon]